VRRMGCVCVCVKNGVCVCVCVCYMLLWSSAVLRAVSLYSDGLNVCECRVRSCQTWFECVVSE
jgi:hypothetical protein